MQTAIILTNRHRMQIPSINCRFLLKKQECISDDVIVKQVRSDGFHPENVLIGTRVQQIYFDNWVYRELLFRAIVCCRDYDDDPENPQCLYPNTLYLQVSKDAPSGFYMNGELLLEFTCSKMSPEFIWQWFDSYWST